MANIMLGMLCYSFWCCIEAASLPTATSAQQAELYRSCSLAKDKIADVYLFIFIVFIYLFIGCAARHVGS